MTSVSRLVRGLVEQAPPVPDRASLVGKALYTVTHGLELATIALNARYHLRSAQKLARAVWLDFGDADVQLSDNAFDLTAGERRTVIFTPAQSGAVPQFSWLDLHSCQTNIE